MTTTITLIRHGETEWNRIGRWQGQADVPLSAEGREQARTLARRLVDEGARFDQIYSSDLKRAYETADIIARALELPVASDPALREIDIGSWSGLTRLEIIEREPQAFKTVFYPADSESHAAFGQRVFGAFERVAQQHPDQHLALVTHGGVIRSIVQQLHRQEATRADGSDNESSWWLDSAPVGNTSLTDVAWDGTHWHLLRYSDTAHLGGAQTATNNEQTSIG